MRTYIILNQQYPFGMACTKRIQYYAKCLCEQNNEVLIIIPKAKIISRKNKVELKGEYEGIPYIHTLPSPYRSKNFFNRRISDTIGPVWAALYCLRNSPDNILFVSSNDYHLVLFKIISLLLGVRLFKENNEVPYFKFETINLRQKLLAKIRYKLYDGVIVITKNLSDFIKQELGFNKKIIIIPVLHDFKIRSEKSYNKDNSNYILYTGSLLEKKDGVITILKSLAIAKDKFPELKLKITGNANTSTDYNLIKQIIFKSKISDSVIFTGFVSENELNDLMVNAKILVLAKPINRQNLYNFPTKIAEYFASGTPVLTTPIKALESYLTAGIDYFVAESIYEFADQIKFILENEEFAKKIGKNGQEKAVKVFNYNIYAKSLYNFLSNNN